MKLLDVCEFIVDCSHSTAPDEGKGYPLIRTPNIGRGRLKLDNVHRVSKDVYDKRNKRAVPQVDDIIFAREAPAGNAAIICDGQEVCLGQRTVLIRPDKNKVYPQYLVYYILAPQQQYELLGTANGATVAHVNIPVIKNLLIQLPEMDKQIKIANTISSYDDMIENNQKQTKLLEEAAQRLYKEWFVDLRFPGHEDIAIVDGVPEGWEKDKAEKFFNITIGKTPPRAEKQWFVNGNDGVPWLSISDMGTSGVYSFTTSEGLTQEAVKKHNMKVVPAGTVFVSFKLTVGRVSIATTAMCTNEAIAHFYIDNDFKQAYTYCYLNNFEYDTLGNTSSISKAVNSKIIKAMPFVMPDEATILAFDRLVAPILMEIKNKQAACIKLKEARDRLLPKLMSGEIEV
ncbi:MAG: restriction endonuclease subunit S [Eubacterium sp.]|nr:restriction endonuclease subunit S [Eubacterium sp.]